jgi:hypothetical protein
MVVVLILLAALGIMLVLTSPIRFFRLSRQIRSSVPALAVVTSTHSTVNPTGDGETSTSHWSVLVIHDRFEQMLGMTTIPERLVVGKQYVVLCEPDPRRDQNPKVLHLSLQDTWFWPLCQLFAGLIFVSVSVLVFCFG